MIIQNYINDLFPGGILCNGITEIAGESASGKTQFCMQLCLTVQLPSNMNGFQSGILHLKKFFDLPFLPLQSQKKITWRAHTAVIKKSF